jgi:hypothetical protein
MRVEFARGTWLLLLALLQWACNAQAVLTQQVEARRLALELQVRFTAAAEASNRAVMSDSDEAAAVQYRNPSGPSKWWSAMPNSWK